MGAFPRILGELAFPRIVIYHRPHHRRGQFVSLLPLLTAKTGVTHVIIAAFHIQSPQSISLNNEPYEHTKNMTLWREICILQEYGVAVLGMLGGAHQRSFAALDGDRDSFEAYYRPIYDMAVWTGINGLDLDVEEAMSLPGIIRLIDRLKTDFGPDFIITLAPTATAISAPQDVSSIDYKDLEKAFSSKVAWYNVQCCFGWGFKASVQDCENIILRGWPASRISFGLVMNPANCGSWIVDEALRGIMRALKKKYPDLGGVMVWEYLHATTYKDGMK